MAEVNTADLQGRYGGRYVASLNGKVIASAATYHDLSQQLERMAVSWSDLVIEYVEPATRVSVY